MYGKTAYLRPHCRRWLSADPLGMLEGCNFFFYAQNEPLLSGDASGLLTVVPLKTDANASCDTQGPNFANIDRPFQFRLSNPAPCDGWFFQRVEFNYGFMQCDCEIHDVPGYLWGLKNERKKVYTEWFGSATRPTGIVREGEVQISPGNGSAGYVDYRTIKNADGKCGIFQSTASVRFYCKKDLDLFDVIERGHKIGVTPIGIGGYPIEETGTIPGRVGTPEFWSKKRPVEEREWGWEAKWTCCDLPWCGVNHWIRQVKEIL